MLILLPPSEGKTAPRRGRPLDLAALSFPELTATRERILDAVGGLDLRMAPAAPAGSVYSGVLYQALALADLDGAALRRARAQVVVVSALWGAVRLRDRIPAYRLPMQSALPGLGPLAGLWRAPLGAVLPAAARRGLVVDCRSTVYATAWRPVGALVGRTVRVRVFREADGVRTVVSHMAKHTRGLVAREIVTTGLDPRRPEELAEALAVRFRVELRAGPPGQPVHLDIVEPG
ncbi:MAG: peroxide stress protein YaaA [Geodermatophilaceae bacterium]|nr:peroxide stress protein YaaA [Geodermatophilaceae bacterium]